LTRLEGLEWDERSLGALVERGARSAIGMAAFTDGGFVVDGGRRSEGSPPPVVARARFPDAWRILLILDPSAQGVHGDRETQAFATLPEFPAATSGHLCRLILLRLLPGLHETDIGAFGSAISEIQEIIGVHFAAVQGGSPWSSPKVGAMARRMAEAGAAGIGQSSWGPTGFALAGSEAAAARLYSTFVEDATAQGLEIRVVRGRNSGATIEWHDKPSSGA
jgi:beta-RFAP synthase